MVQGDLEESGGNPLVGSTFCLGQDESVNNHIWCHRCLDIFHSSLFYGQAFNPLPSAKPPAGEREYIKPDCQMVDYLPKIQFLF